MFAKRRLMSKETPKDGQTVELPFKEKYIAAEVRIAELEHKSITREREVVKLQKENSKYKRQLGEDDSLPDVAEPSKSPLDAPKTEKAASQTPLSTPHVVKSYQPRYCADCGTANPAFKDETKCSTPGCGVHLGALEAVKGLKACPNCGGSKFDVIGK